MGIMRWAVGVTLLIFGLGSFGVWLLVEGGRDAFDGVWLTGAGLAAILGGFVLWGGRRRI
jgi:hypothetical protein